MTHTQDPPYRSANVDETAILQPDHPPSADPQNGRHRQPGLPPISPAPAPAPRRPPPAGWGPPPAQRQQQRPPQQQPRQFPPTQQPRPQSPAPAPAPARRPDMGWQPGPPPAPTRPAGPGPFIPPPRTGREMTPPRAGLDMAPPRAGLDMAPPRTGRDMPPPRTSPEMPRPSRETPPPRVAPDNLEHTFIIEPIRTPPTRVAAEMALRHASWRPGILTGLIPCIVVFVFSLWLARPGHGPLGWALTVLWSWPILSSLVGIYGALNTRIHLTRKRKFLADTEAFRCNEMLIVVVPTIGRYDTYPALERSVLSYVHHLPSCFPTMRVDVITEEGCEADRKIQLLAARSPLIRVVTVPKSYTTKNGTRFKARANNYSHELRIAESEARDDVWVLHMDDDTGVGMDTAIAMAQFIERQRWAGADARHLGQGILTYPRENAVNKLTWLADAVRPADDIARFAAFTGAGTPLSGLHGELLLVRASIEATIGWDFGPKAIVEDAQLALTFCKRYPGRSSWFQGRCYGASPATVRDFIKQRERWAWGLVGLATNRTIPLRHRIFLGYSVVSWVAGPLQHVAFVLLVGALLGDMNTTPVSLAILPLWAINMGYTVWMYLEGLKINARASDNGRRRWWEPIAVVGLIPLFSLLEGIGGFLGFIKFIRRAENKFVVIAKPA